jgi:hypothetical protein
MKRKVDRIRDAWNSGDQISALRIAARFFDRSTDAKIFKRGMAAHNNPAFYRQIGAINQNSAERTGTPVRARLIELGSNLYFLLSDLSAYRLASPGRGDHFFFPGFFFPGRRRRRRAQVPLMMAVARRCGASKQFFGAKRQDLGLKLRRCDTRGGE